MVQQWPARSRSTEAAQAHVTRKGCKVIYMLQVTSGLCAGRAGVVLQLQATVENKRLCRRNTILRYANAQNKLKSKLLFKEMNKTEDLPAMYFTVLVIMILQGPGPVATKMPFFFSLKFELAAKFFSSSPRRSFLPPSNPPDRLEKSFIIFP